MDIRFPHLGINIEHLGQGIQIGGFSIAYYGMIIALGMIGGYGMAYWQAKRTGQEPELYLDLALWDIIFAILGARIYYVIFSWDYYSQNPGEILNLRGGGMAIYGGVIAGTVTTFVFAKIRKKPPFELMDTACTGLLVGQIIGRWGNFFNREAFGGYTDNLFAMQIPRDDVRTSDLNDALLSHLVNLDGVEYIQVHPTFLYESLWNILLLVLLVFCMKKKQYHGQIFLLYLLGYGLGRVWIESLRTDQLQLFQTGIAVSQLLSGLLVLLSAGLLLMKYLRMRARAGKREGETSAQEL